METKNLEIALELFGKEYIKILARELRNARKDSSGKLIDSLTSDVVDAAKELSLILSAEKYIEYIDKGRLSGSYPPIAAILKWASLKGIDKRSAFAIQKSIYKFGIKPTNIISKAYDISLNSLKKHAEDGYSKDIEEYFNNLNKK